MTLFFKELRGVVQSVLYIVFAGAVALFFVSQFGLSLGGDFRLAETEPWADSRNPLAVPQPGAASYGSDKAEIPEMVMPAAIDSLYDEAERNEFVTYPIGFYKLVRLNDAELQTVRDTVEWATGLGWDELGAQMAAWRTENMIVDENGFATARPGANPNDAVPIVVDYAAFREKMAAIDALLGGGSTYAPENLFQLGQAELTYEQAMERYQDVIYADKITGAYARLYCDYMGIAVALFAVFVPVGFMMRDRRARMQELVYARRCSSAKLVCVRYLACLVAVLLPVLLLAIIPTVQLVAWAAGQGFSTAPFAFFATILGWVAPTAMVACSVGFVFTILTGTPLGIFVQFLWSFIDIFTGTLALHGAPFGTRLTLRHNYIGGRAQLAANWDSLVANRVGYLLLSLVLLGASILLYELQRRGLLDIRASLDRLLRRRKNAVPADAAA